MSKIKKICKKCKNIFYTYPCKINTHNFCSKKCSNDFRKGKPLSREHRKKLSESLSGENNPFYGKQHTKESKEKLRNSKKGKRVSIGTEFKKGMTPWNKGKKLPQFSGKNNPGWKGGQTSHNGYIYILRRNHPNALPNGYVKRCRIAIEKQLNRFLKQNETIHHLGEKTDDSINMLIAFNSQSAHVRFHKNPKNVKPSEIIFDGRKYHN